ncbi:MAG: Eco57I restriction-modification methylase domain-containing protein [Aquiluna sp.]|nr:Eco57I restriction-modification methylase domain-containing protein [Aquiluna sp.]
MSDLNPWDEFAGLTDVLDTLAQLPNDEVLTPPHVARSLLSLLPEEVWLNPDLRWCDPFAKSGVFLREVYKRLMVSLESWESDPVRRRTHILQNMIFASAITELTSRVVRRTLYQSIDATGKGVVDPEARELLVPFDSHVGNVWYERGDHAYKPGKTTCTLCGGAKRVVDAERENFAYPLLHNQLPFGGKDMQFDIIVGNPPYQIGMKDETGERTRNISPLYDRFVDKAINMKPKYILMITPSRWFSSGKTLDKFRVRMLADRRLKKMVDYPNGSEIFPTVQVKGGISYFLWDRDHDGDCEFEQIVDGESTGVRSRDLRTGDGVLVRDWRGMQIVDKVRSHREFNKNLAEMVSTRDPFGGHLTTNYQLSKPEEFEGSIPLVFGNKIGHISPDQISDHRKWVSKFKVLIPKAYGGKVGVKGLQVLGEPIALAPGSACTQTYLVAGHFSSKEETVNYAKYLSTKFVRFLVLQRKTTQDVTSERFKFAPLLPMNRAWTDEELYRLFELDQDEVAHIEWTVADRGFIDSSDSPVPFTHLPGGTKFGKQTLDDD